MESGSIASRVLLRSGRRLSLCPLSGRLSRRPDRFFRIAGAAGFAAGVGCSFFRRSPSGDCGSTRHRNRRRPASGPPRVSCLFTRPAASINLFAGVRRCRSSLPLRRWGAVVQVKWDKVSVQTANGLVSGIAPVIISASRATDIPAFYGEWFAGRLAAGYLAWTNPFNSRQKQVVSFAKTRVVVFWSKNPAPIERYLEQLDERGINYYFTFTVNDYEQEGLEKSVPPLAERLATFRRLSDRLGSERVVWRFDPIIVGGSLTPERILEKIEHIGDQLHRHTRKLVISFVDISRYRTVRENLRRSGFGDSEEPGPEAVQRIARGFKASTRTGGSESPVAPRRSISRLSASPTTAASTTQLMARVFPHDAELMAFLGRGSGSVAPLFADGDHAANPFKDRNQRESCGCIVSKDIGRYNTCPHHCAYCYANSSFQQAADASRDTRRGARNPLQVDKTRRSPYCHVRNQEVERRTNGDGDNHQQGADHHSQGNSREAWACTPGTRLTLSWGRTVWSRCGRSRSMSGIYAVF